MPANPIFTDPNDSLLVARLARISEELRTLTLSTVEDYQADVYSDVNSVLSLGIAMTPLKPVASEGPAVIGDVTTNYTLLNNDAQDIANEILQIEDATANSFNLAAASQNQLRQQIREFIYSSNPQRYSEDFLNTSHLTSITANIDCDAGLATNTLLDTVQLSPAFSTGPTSIGAIDTSSSLANLTDGDSTTTLLWNGSTLELILTFATPRIMNRIEFNMDTYNELEIDTFTTSPDGTLIEDVLAVLNVDSISLDGTSCKFSGDVIIDFPPRYVQTARLIILDKVGIGLVSFREISCYAIRYFSTGQLTTLPINSPTGTIAFSSIQNVFAPYVSITHQISYDGTQFTAINPGDTISLLSSPFFYRAVLERSSSRFDSVQGPLVQSPLDPISSSYYTLTSTTTTPLGNGIIERTLQINSVTGPIVLREVPMPNTLVIQEGSVILSTFSGDYSFTNNSIIFPSTATGLTITYQTSSLGDSALKDEKEYYTALLYEFKFETT